MGCVFGFALAAPFLGLVLLVEAGESFSSFGLRDMPAAISEQPVSIFALCSYHSLDSLSFIVFSRR